MTFGPISERERLARLRLARTARVGPVAFSALLARYRSAERVLDALPDIARKSGGGVVPVTEADALAELGRGEAIGARLLVLGDEDFPAQLAALDPPPPVLWTLGDAGLLGRAGVAVVGARIASAAGQRFARGLAQDLGNAGYVVASGLARGVDGAAHQGALASGTVAVLGGGVDDVYPPEHRDLYGEIAERGCLVSESPVGHRAQAKDFPRRNRLISGLSLGVVVVEAEMQSGSLITARLAAEQGREVFAIPGSIHSPQARGCHALIRQGAKLVESAQDILEELRIPDPLREPRPGAVTASSEDSLLEQMGFDPVGLDALQARCGLDTPTLQARLLELELDGLVARLPGGLLQRIGTG